jgi:hypothetical protein
MLMLTITTGCKSRLAQAVEQGDESTALYLLGTAYDSRGKVTHYASDPNERINGKPLLTRAIEHGKVAVAKVLAQTEGTDTNALDLWGVTPLHAAATQCNTEISIVLLKYRANPNVKAPRRKWVHTNPISTPLEGAVVCHNWELFSALLFYGALPDAASVMASLRGCDSVGYDPRYTIALNRRLPEVIDQLNTTERSMLYGCRDVLRRAMENNIKIDPVEPK